MHDDEINDLVQALKDAGIPQTQVKRTLEVLGQAEALGIEFGIDVAESRNHRLKETVADALRRIFEEEAETTVKS